jgi:hypothetical protein
VSWLKTIAHVANNHKRKKNRLMVHIGIRRQRVFSLTIVSGNVQLTHATIGEVFIMSDRNKATRNRQ